jgi:hypothetical protein
LLLERVSGSLECLVVEGESLGVGKERGLGLVMAVLADIWSSALCCMRLRGSGRIPFQTERLNSACVGFIIVATLFVMGCLMVKPEKCSIQAPPRPKRGAQAWRHNGY